MEREQLTAIVDARIETFISSNDPAFVLAPEALAEASALAAVDPGSLEVAHTLGMFFHCRVVAADQVGAGDPESPDSVTAMRYFRVLHDRAPDLLPDGVFAILVEVWPADAEMLATWNSRAVALLGHGRRNRTPEAVVDGVGLLEHVVARCADAMSRTGYLSNLALAYRVKFLLSNDEEDVAAAIRTGTLAVESATTDEERRGCRSNLAIARTARFEVFGDAADLDHAVRELRTCLDGVAASDLVPGRLSNLAASLASRAEITGDRMDLDEAVRLLEQAVTLTNDPREQAEYLSNLAAAHQDRFILSGDTTDLDLEVEAARKAVVTAAEDPIVGPAMRNNLGLALRSRYQRLRRDEDLDDAVAQFEHALGDVPPGAERARYLSNQSTALRVRFSRHGRRHDIDEAVRTGAEAVGTSGLPSGVAARHRSNLCAALSSRFGVTGHVADLDDACAVGRLASESVPPHDRSRGSIFANLGLALLKRAEHLGREQDLVQAAQAYADAATSPGAPPLVRAISAQACGRVNADLGRWSAATEAFGQAISLLGEVANGDLDLDDQSHLLGDLAGLGSAAAAAALADDGDARRALALLERGRGVMLTRLLNVRGDLDELRARDEHLADTFDGLRHELNRAVPAQVEHRPERAARRTRLARDRDDLVREIRGIPGHEMFLLPRVTDDLLRSPVDGPVVAINVAAHRCDAVVLSAAGVRSFPLPGLSQAEAIVQANKFLLAVHDPNTPDADQHITEVLEWLWDAVAADVLDELGPLLPQGGGGTPARVWWMPTGALSVLPIHAAGHHDVPGRSVLDQVVSSYTPALRALHEAAKQEPAAVDLPLIVAVPNPPGARELPGARSESEQVASWFSGRATVLVDEDAHREQVLAALLDCTWVHFACHADTDADRPFESSLRLQDDVLRARELSALRIRSGSLAYLSACTTAFGGTGLFDEAIHIASVCQLAGFRDVVGTLWRVKDIPAEKMAEWVYRELAELRPAFAVHAAQRGLRERYSGYPHLWASHVHIGP